MTKTITRRAAIAGAVSLPILPAAPGARSATANATDAAWAKYVPANAAVEVLDADFDAGVDHDDEVTETICDPWRSAGDAVLEAPVATLTDVERKLAVLDRLAEGSMLNADDYTRLLAQVRTATGSAAV